MKDVQTSLFERAIEFIHKGLFNLRSEAAPVKKIKVVEGSIDFYPDVAIWLEDKRYPLGTKHIPVWRFDGIDRMSGPDYTDVNPMAHKSYHLGKAPF